MRKNMSFGLLNAFFAGFMLTLCLPTMADPWPGSGTADNPYQISDANGLEYLGSHPEYYGNSFILTADIDLSGRSYATALIAPDTAAGTDYEGTAFAGRFDGNYHVISNLTIDTLGFNTCYLGLFGNTMDASIKHLGLENVSITSGARSCYIGTLIATKQNGTVDQCYAIGTILGGLQSIDIGGLVNAYGGSVSNCYADVDVVAGLVAENLGGFAGTAYGIFSHCYAVGFVNDRTSAGGFAGVKHDWFSLIDYCFFLAPADGGGPDNGIGTALSDTAMRQQASFVNWDFLGNAADGLDEIWQINGGYPVLAWQVPVGLCELSILSRYWQMTGCTSGQPCSIADWYDDDSIDTADLDQLIHSWLEPVVTTDYPKVQDDFETGDFTKLPWVHGGDADWTIISGADVYQGTYCARSGAIDNSQSSTLELTANITETSEIVFAVKVSSQEGYDVLNFYIDGSVRMMDLSGQHDWNEMRFGGFSTGVHTFKWSYSKNSGGSAGSDCVWIDNVRILHLEE